MFLLITILILSYLIGSIPWSIIITKLVANKDIREHGSGNAGGTNVTRVLGWKYGLLVILLDAFKGVTAVVFIARLHYGNFPFNNQTPFDDFTLIQIMAGGAAILGHVWTIFANFKGGKGIATGLGILVAIATIDLLIAVGVFVLVVAYSRYISLGSIMAALSIPIALIVRANIFHVNITSYYTLLPFFIGLSLLIVFTHRKNILRLLNGSESKFSFSKKKIK